jgi:pyruvate,water dikinase
LKRNSQVPKNFTFKDKIILRLLRPPTIRGIYQRENYRLKRGKVFNMAREVFLEIARRMVAAGDLQEEDDIFYLYKGEIFDYLRFHSLKADFKTVVSVRKKIIESYKDEQMPRRVITRGLPSEERMDSPLLEVNKIMEGQGTSQGKAEGEVIVMNKLDLTADYKGKILVTTATDPGWTIIFPLLKGVVTEQGGLLSHASIIARELGFPCIVKVKDATKILKNGQTIELDAIKGKITLLN